MTTAIQGAYSAPTATNITQSITRDSLSTDFPLPVILNVSPTNFSKVYYAYFTISGSYASPTSLSISSTVLNGNNFTRVSNTVIFYFKRIY
jgi:hypothetical protein